MLGGLEEVPDLRAFITPMTIKETEVISKMTVEGVKGLDGYDGLNQLFESSNVEKTNSEPNDQQQKNGVTPKPISDL